MSEEADFKLMNAAFLHAVEVPSRNSLMKELVGSVSPFFLSRMLGNR